MVHTLMYITIVHLDAQAKFKVPFTVVFQTAQDEDEHSESTQLIGNLTGNEHGGHEYDISGSESNSEERDQV
jgi:hypothetical protein